MKLDAIIRSTGFELARQRKHKVYKHAELRKTLTVPSTPSDRRSDSKTLAQLSRLTGIRKRDLLTPPVRRKRRRKHKDEAPPPPPQIMPAEIAQPESVPAPLTRAEKNYLKQLKKHEIHRQKKLARQRERLQPVVDKVHEFFRSQMFERGLALPEDAREELPDRAALSLYFAVKEKMGFRDVELMAAEVVVDRRRLGQIMVVRAGCWYLDYFEGKVHDTPEWVAKFENGDTHVSVFGALRVMKEDDGISISD